MNDASRNQPIAFDTQATSLLGIVTDDPDLKGLSFDIRCHNDHEFPHRCQQRDLVHDGSQHG